LADRSSRAPGRALAAGVLAALAVSGCGGRGGEEMESEAVPTIEARTAKVERRDLVEPLVVRGTVAAPPNEDVRLAPLVAGRVVAMHVAEGDAVRAGGVVAEIDPRPLQDQARQAQAALSQARAAREAADLELTRVKRLYERGIAAGKEVEDARAARAAAAAAVEEGEAGVSLAQRQVDRARVRSPIAGHVVRRFVGVGEQVDGTPAQPVVEIANVANVEVAARVGAERLARVRPGQPAAITSDAWPGRTFAGRVVAVAPAVDPATNAALVRIRVANADRALKVGMFAEAAIALSTRPGVLTVPPGAVSRGGGEDAEPGGGTAVYVVAKDEAVRRPVTLGLETPEAVEVVSGVKEGETVLASAVHGLAEKARLAAKP
jgi:membrane fusion protein (multidrug efflux system)